MRIDDETLMAYCDGALPDAERARVAAALAMDPALVRQLDLLRLGGEAARGAFADVLEEPVPPRLLAAITAAAGTGTAVPASAPRADSAAGQRRWPRHDAAPPAPVRARHGERRRMARQGMAIAASLLLGLVGGWTLHGLRGGSDGAARIDGAVLAALQDAPSGAPAAGGVRLLGSHATADGIPCRVFAAPGGADGLLVQGLACRDPKAGGWALRAMVTKPAAPAGFVPASAEDPLLVDMLDRLGAGPALTEAEERTAIGRGWVPATP